MVLMLTALLGGCASQHYEQTVPGELKGDLIVRWHKPNKFVYLPDEDNPLRFTRGTDGDVLQPEEMETDGGSVPRQFWVLKNFSPWGYGPAFVIHDWLFRMQHCQLPGHERYDLETAAVIMSEVMRTLIDDPDFNYGSKSSMYLMHEAVKTPVARLTWESRDCDVDRPIERGIADEEFTLSF